MIERLKNIIIKVTPTANVDTVTEATRLREELNFDSLSMIMMSMEIEEEFGFKFNELVKFDTVGDVCRYIEERNKRCVF